jgi:hypothetical protein
LAETTFELTILNTSTDDFARTFSLREIYLALTEVKPQTARVSEASCVYRWRPLPAGGDEVDDPENPDRGERLVILGSEHGEPVPLFKNAWTPVPPYGGYTLKVGREITFPLRVALPGPGDRIEAMRALEESGQRSEMRTGIRRLVVLDDDLRVPECLVELAGSRDPDQGDVAGFRLELKRERFRIDAAVNEARHLISDDGHLFARLSQFT